ncbi:MAG: ParB N-terminal domain-containing protein [gamma proteobacterium symbiont of Lucinoma myriamae]|nr:ParB N-terminal domain-containing protein [gamma proteobacterium symbiont of Lucinoma myriamae]MCU7819863.1 ParB N-terminal domain-containing protein [gamma proteobacterium symbiont of Lucinoma myriamae]
MTKRKLSFPGFVPKKTTSKINTETITEIKVEENLNPAKKKRSGAGMTKISETAAINLKDDYNRLKIEEKNFIIKESEFQDREEKFESKINQLELEQQKVKKLIEEEGEFCVDIDPRECQVIKIPGRIQKLLNEQVCDDLIKDFNSHIGQKEPIYIRPIPDDVEKINNNIKYEVFAGTRRRWAAEHVVNELNQKFRLKAFIKKLSDEEASVFTEKENAKVEWADVEFGFFYSELLANGTYKTQQELAKKRNIDKSMVTEYLRFGTLRDDFPSIISAFDELSNLLELRKLWVKKLLMLLEDNGKEKAILSKTSSLIKVGKKLSSNFLYNSLIKAAENTYKTDRLDVIKESIKNKKGKESIGTFTRSSVNNIDIKIKSKSTLTKEELKKEISMLIDKYYKANM